MQWMCLCNWVQQCTLVNLCTMGIKRSIMLILHTNSEFDMNMRLRQTGYSPAYFEINLEMIVDV